MLTPLPLGIGLRYVRSRRRSFFVSFITWVSLAGVCLGVATELSCGIVRHSHSPRLHRNMSSPAHAGGALSLLTRTELAIARARRKRVTKVTNSG